MSTGIIDKYLDETNLTSIYNTVKDQCTEEQFPRYLTEAFDAIQEAFLNTNTFDNSTSEAEAVATLNTATADLIRTLIAKDGPTSAGEAILRAENDIWQRQSFDPRRLVEKPTDTSGILYRPLEHEDTHASNALQVNTTPTETVPSNTTDDPTLLANNQPSSKKPLPPHTVEHTRQQVFDHIPYESRNNVAFSRRIPYTYMLDSRDRNTDKFTAPNDYYVDTFEVFRNVTSVGLMAAVIPNTTYNIYEGINRIHFEETNGTELVAEIAPGNYDNTTIAAAIKTALEATVGANSTYTVTLDTSTLKLTIVSNLAGGGGVFNLNFAGLAVKKGFDGTNVAYNQGSIGPFLGYAPVDLSGSNTYTGTGVVNLNTLPYFLLFIDNLEKYESTTVPSKAFCQILRNSLGTEGGSNTTSGQPYTLHTHRAFLNIKHFSPPLAKLDRLKIRLTDYYGNVLDFNGADHSLLLEITTVEDIDRKI